MKQFRIILVLFTFFALALGNVSAQSSFTVNQNIINLGQVFNCGSPNLPSYNGQDVVNLVSVKVEVDHDISGSVPGSPNLPGTINSDGYRHIRFRVFKAVNGQIASRSPEVVITKTANWLSGAASPNGSSVRTYHLTTADLQAANVSGGAKIVKVSADFEYTNFLTHNVDLNVSYNGYLTCSQINFANNNSTLNCPQTSIAGCFKFYPCDGNVSIIGSAQWVFGPGGWFLQYTYSSFVNGGSGSYSYAWSMDPAISFGSNSTFVFAYSSNINAIFLTVTDNVTGCEYEAVDKFKMSNIPQPTEAPFDFTVGPNPSQAGSPLNIRYLLPEADVVDLALYDLSGRMVKSLVQDVDGHLGANTLSLETEGLDAGVYFVRLNATNSGHLTKKIMIIE